MVALYIFFFPILLLIVFGGGLLLILGAVRGHNKRNLVLKWFCIWLLILFSIALTLLGIWLITW